MTIQSSSRAPELTPSCSSNETKVCVPFFPLKLTTARVYRLSGEPFESAGVMPDVPLEPADELPRFGSMDDPALIAAIAKLREQKSQGQR